MFYEKHKSSYLVINFHYVIDTVYIYYWKLLIKFWPILVMLYVYIFIACGVQHDNRVNPPGTYSLLRIALLPVETMFVHILREIYV